MQCHQTNPSHIQTPMTLKDPSPAPFHTLIWDTLGPLKTSDRGNKHLVTVTDVCTRYVITWATPDLKVKTLAKQFYDNVIMVHGCCKVLMSDNGSSFVSELFHELCNLMHISQRFSSAYRAQTQGQVERAHRSIISLLRNFVSTKQTDWDYWLPSLTYALNTSEAYALGYSPFFLVFGREPTFPSELSLPDPFAATKTVKDFLTDMLQNQEIATECAATHLKSYQAKMKERYDENSNDRTVHPGDIVYIYLPRLHVPQTKKKLQPSWAGPYSVVRLTTPVTAKLKRLSDGKYLKKSVHISRMKIGHVRQNVEKWDPLPPLKSLMIRVMTLMTFQSPTLTHPPAAALNRAAVIQWQSIPGSAHATHPPKS